MSPTYEHFFWTIAIDNADTSAEPVDIGVAKRAQLRKAALDLNAIPTILLATADGGTAAMHPEICLLLAVEEHDTVNEYATHIEKALATHGLDAKLTLQEETRFYDFDETEVKCVRACQCIPSGEDEKAKIYRLIESVETLPLPDPDDVDSSSNDNNVGGNGVGGIVLASAAVFASGNYSNTANTTAQQRAPVSFAITAEKYEELKNAKGDELREALRKLYGTIYNLRDEIKNSIVTARLASAGVVTVGVAMHTAYQRLIGASIAAGVAYKTGLGFAYTNTALLTARGPVTLGVVISTVGMKAIFLLKDATNVLLLANDSDFDLTYKDDDVTNGQRCSVVTTIPAMVRAHSKLGYPAVYPCGAFVYQKKAGTWYGSLFGVEFSARKRAWTDRISIGMDSPNSAFGGSNSIFVTGHDASKAMAGARDGNAENDTAKTPQGQLTGRRAHKWGPINYGFAFYKAA